MSKVISAQMVSALRERTGAGLMDCKRALTEAGGDTDQAETLLRKRGVVQAAKKAGRATSDGLVESYIHLGGKVGVLIEVNCETDFVAKTDDFKGFCRDLCLQIAAAGPIVVKRDEVSAELVEKEKEIAEAQASGKPPGGRAEDRRGQDGQVLFNGLPARPAFRQESGSNDPGASDRDGPQVG